MRVCITLGIYMKYTYSFMCTCMCVVYGVICLDPQFIDTQKMSVTSPDAAARVQNQSRLTKKS